MAKILIINFLGLVLATQLLSTVSGLQCYDCEAKKGVNNDCEINVQNVILTYCPKGFVCTFYTRSFENETNIRRLCSPSNECEIVSAVNSHILNPEEKGVIHCASCSNSDGCNTANTFVLNFTQFSVMSILVIALNVLNNKLSFLY
ncbi:uncharacterized protein [Euwallacea fornicatus]|uniref:uncharacterized protein n=1 Tax=Euwallacea fornicatus TaxID=995702 RepID=UPI00338F501C